MYTEVLIPADIGVSGWSKPCCLWDTWINIFMNSV